MASSGLAVRTSQQPRSPTTSRPPPSTTEPKPKGFKGWLAKKGQPSAEGRTRAVDLPPPAVLIQLIAKDVPLPTPKQRSDAYHAVWSAMQVNDSISVAPAAAKRLIGWAREWAKPRNFKFITKHVDADTARIWRTE